MNARTTAADKPRQQAMAKIEKVAKELDQQMEIFGPEKAKTEAFRDLKAWKAKVEAAKKEEGAAGTKSLTALVKTGEALLKTNTQRAYDNFAAFRRNELKGQVNGALAGALLEIGKIADPAVTKMVFAEQTAMRARMDKAEKMKNDLEAVTDMDDLDDEMPALMKRIKSAQAVSAWLGTGFKSMLALAESAIASVPSQRCRNVLRAELDFVEQAKNDALPKLEVKAIETATVATLRRIQKVATRLSADGSALDRELVRVGKLVKESGSSELAAKLKKLAQDKAQGFPQVRDFQDFEKTLDGFEKSLATLAAEAQKAQMAKAH